jgi:hypothetical protein
VMCTKYLFLPTPAISQTSAVVLSEFSYKILAFSDFAGSVYISPRFCMLPVKKNIQKIDGKGV